MAIEIPDDLLFTKEHEWARRENDIVVVGITEYAKDSLGDIVFVELPRVGEEVTQNDAFGVVESVKAVTDLFCPISGEVIEINDTLTDAPEMINQDPYGEGWIVKIKFTDDSELHNLLEPSEYLELISAEGKGE